MKMDTVFSLFILVLLLIFIGINLYADATDRFAVYHRRMLKANDRASRTFLKHMSVDKYEKQKNKTTKRELKKLYKDEKYQQYLSNYHNGNEESDNNVALDDLFENV